MPVRLPPVPVLPEAACTDHDPELWTVEVETAPNQLLAQDMRRRAKEICRSCPELIECGTYAVNNGIVNGVWGGMDERDLKRARRIVRSRKVVVGTTAYDLARTR